MKDNKSELEFENKRLRDTIALAKIRRNEEIERNEENESSIISAKQELRENTQHSISDLWSSDGFEALVELSQHMNSVDSKIADYEATENRILRLEQLIQSPYFARIDFKFDDEETFEKIYIGRSSLEKEDSYEMYVYDWRAPIASVFYRFVLGKAFYDAPNGRITGEVNLKRQFEINNGTLEYFFDVDVQVIDEFLRKLLSQNTSSQMKTIVETILKEQDIVIRDMENELMMVQGVAGSGKTSIALHRAAYLMYQGLSTKLSANNIIIISPNSLFEQYISNVLPELGENNVVSIVFEDILLKVSENKKIQSRNKFLENLITSPDYRDIIKSSIEFKTSPMFLEILNRFIDDIPLRWIDFKDVHFEGRRMISKETLKERILSGRKETPLGLKLKLLEDFILELIRESKETRINKSEAAGIKEELRKFTELQIEDLYRMLLNEKDYFYSLSEDLKLPECIEEILVFTQENLCDSTLHYDDAIVLAYLNLKINGANHYKNIKQVVIDEAQDYYSLQFEIFNLLFSNSKYTILGDINQTLEKEENLSLYEQIKNILSKKKSNLIIMDKSFRCTNEILNFSSKFIENGLEIKSFNRNGDEPKIFTALNQSDLDQMIISESKSCLEKGYRSIGLICKTEKNCLSLFKSLKGKIDVQLIKNESTADLNGILIIPVYMSKGLEFDAVLICDAEVENYHSEDDKKLLYVACTRALHRLSLFCKGEVN